MVLNRVHHTTANSMRSASKRGQNHDREKDRMSFPEMIRSEIHAGRADKSASLHVALKASGLPLPTRIAVIGNYLPRECGIATFTTDLCNALAAEYGENKLWFYIMF